MSRDSFRASWSFKTTFREKQIVHDFVIKEFEIRDLLNILSLNYCLFVLLICSVVRNTLNTWSTITWMMCGPISRGCCVNMCDMSVFTQTMLLSFWTHKRAIFRFAVKKLQTSSTLGRAKNFWGCLEQSFLKKLRQNLSALAISGHL